MGEDSYGFTNVCYAVMNDDGEYGEFHELGEAVSLNISTPDDETERWANAIAALPTCTSFQFRFDWWQQNRLCKLLLDTSPPYTIRRLRRSGKSHKRR